MPTNEVRQKRVHEVPESVFAVYTSTELTKTIKQLLVTYKIENKDPFIDCVGDTLIGLYQRSALEQNLISKIGLTPDIARAVSQELKPFFDKLEGGAIPETDSSLKERLEFRPDGTAVVQPSTGESSAPKTLTREELLSALSAKRTMASDIEAMKRAQTPPPQS